MHELSIAMSILELVEEEAQRRGDVRVAAVHLKLGPMSGVVKEALASAFELARESTDFSDCQLVIEPVPIVALCPACGMEQTIESMQNLRCPICETPTPQIITGRELEVAAMEIYE